MAVGTQYFCIIVIKNYRYHEIDATRYQLLFFIYNMFLDCSDVCGRKRIRETR